MGDNVYFGLVLTALISVAQCGEMCTDYSYDLFDTDKDTFWCDSGCCGEWDNQYCCIPSEVGTIIGIVIGVLVLVAIIVSVIVAICCCRRRAARQGQVIGGGQTMNMTTTTIGGGVVTTTQTGYPGYPQMQQTAVGTYPAPQPVGGAYPPPQPAGGAYASAPVGMAYPPPAGNQPMAQPPPYDQLEPK